MTLVKAWALARPSRTACIAALVAAEVPCAAVQAIDEVVADPHMIARGMIVEQDHPVPGRVRLPNMPVRFSDCDTSPLGPAPLMGQHNRAIAEGLGYSSDAVDARVRDGVLFAEPVVATSSGS